MRLFEFSDNASNGRQYLIGVWVEYEAASRDQDPNEISKRAEWLEHSLTQVAETYGLSDVGSGGYIGAAGGSRDISFLSYPAPLNDTLQKVKNLIAGLDKLKHSIDSTAATLGLMKMSISFSYDVSISLDNGIQDGYAMPLGGLEEIDDLLNNKVSIEQLIDKASEDYD